MSPYKFSEKELNVFSYGINRSLPISKVNKAISYLDFEPYFNQLSKFKFISKG